MTFCLILSNSNLPGTKSLRRFLKMLLIVESTVIVACGLATALSFTNSVKFVSTYRAICSVCMIATFSFLGTVVALEFLFKENPMRSRIVRIVVAALVPLVASSMCGWIFSASIVDSEIQSRAYLQFVTWLGVLPITLAAALFFKVPAAPPKS